MTDPREELIRRGIALSNAGDYEAVLDFIDPEIEVRTDTELGNTGVYRGHDGYLAWIQSWLDVWDDFSLEVDDVERIGDHFLTFILSRGRGKGSGIEVSAPLVWIFTIPADRATRIHLVRDRETALRALDED